MIVCHCHAVTDRDIRVAVRQGARTSSEVAQACAAGACCGGCAPVVDEIIETETDLARARGFAAFPKLAVVS